MTMSDFSIVSFLSGVLVGSASSPSTPPATSAPQIVYLMPPPVAPAPREPSIQELVQGLPSLREEQDAESEFNPLYPRDWAKRHFDQVPVFPRFGRSFPGGKEYAYFVPAGVLVEFPLLEKEGYSPRQTSLDGWVIVKIPRQGRRSISAVLTTSEQVASHLTPMVVTAITPLAVEQLAPKGWWEGSERKTPVPLWVYGAGFQAIGKEDEK